MSKIMQMGDKVHILSPIIDIVYPDGNSETVKGNAYGTAEEAAMGAAMVCHGSPVGTRATVRLYLVEMTITDCIEDGPPITLVRRDSGVITEGCEA